MRGWNYLNYSIMKVILSIIIDPLINPIRSTVLNNMMKKDLTL